MFDGRGELSVSAFDILERNSSLSQTSTATYIEDLRTNTLQRYVMLTFTYRFNNLSL